MAWIARLVTFAGIVAIFLPAIAAVLTLVPGQGFPLALTRAPTFVIGGIVLFVVGTIMRVYTAY